MKSLKSGFGIVQDHWKWRRSIDHTWLSIGGHCKYSSMLYHFLVIWCWIISWPSQIWVRGHTRSFKLIWFKSLGAVSYLPYVVTMALCCIISETKRDIGKKNCDFSVPPCIWHPRWNIAMPFGMEKLECCGYPTVKNFWGYV